MCGFCAEGRAVALAKVLTSGGDWPPILEGFYFLEAFYAQESEDALTAIWASIKKRLLIIEDTARWIMEGLGEKSK